MPQLVVLAAFLGLLLTIAGAVGAHVIGADDPSWNSAMLFGFVHTLAALVAAALPLAGRLKLAAGWAFLAGVLLFSFALIARSGVRSLAAGDPASWLAMSAPVGGLSFMAGWLLLALAGLRALKAY